MAKITVMGGSDCQPTWNNDCSSYLIGEHLMVDTGWGAPLRMVMADKSVLPYTTLLLTHMHADHVLGLPQLLCEWVNRDASLNGLTIAGPCETLRECFAHAWMFTFCGEAKDLSRPQPRLLELQPRDQFETEEFIIRTAPSIHAVPGRCYRITDKATGHTLGLTGDTGWKDDLVDFFRDVDLLIHEHSYSNRPTTTKHSNTAGAVRMANECGAKALMLTHTRNTDSEACLALARSLLARDIPLIWARTGITAEF